MQGDVPMSAQGWIGRVLSDAMGGWGRPREATVQEIGQLLLSQDPATQMKAISLMSMPGRLPPLLRMGELGAGGTAGGSVFLTSP